MNLEERDDREWDLRALEQFVVDNEDLSELEARIGRFNVFDALGVARVEIRHSNFLAWLLDPNESHGQGSTFLRSVLMDVLRESPGDLRPFSPIELDGVQLRGVRVRREWHNIDILIECDEPRFVVVIENKIDSGEHGNQLKNYELRVTSAFQGTKVLYVFLTTDGSEPSRANWVPYSYADLYRVLDRSRRANRGAIGDDVLLFLNHYLGLIGSRFMSDSEIDQLCERIYKNHRRALDLIYEKVGAPSARLLAGLEDLVKGQPARWFFGHRTSKDIDFIPQPWLSALPPIGTRKNVDRRMWIRLGFTCGDGRCSFWCYGYPTEDPKVRRRVLERLTRDPSEFGLEAHGSGIGVAFPKLFFQAVHTWPEEEEPDLETLSPAAQSQLDKAWDRLAGASRAIEQALSETRQE